MNDTPNVGRDCPLKLDLLINAHRHDAYEVIEARVTGYTNPGKGSKARRRAKAVAAAVEARPDNQWNQFAYFKAHGYWRTGRVPVRHVIHANRLP